MSKLTARCSFFLNLSVTCWLAVGRLSVTCRSTVGRQLTDSRPTGFLGSSSSQLPTLKQFWEIEGYGTELCDRIVCTEEENVALEKVSSSVRYNNGRYSFGVPWKKTEASATQQSANGRISSSQHREKSGEERVC